MRKSHNIRVAGAAFSVCALLAIASFKSSGVRAENELRRVSLTIRVTPPAPVFDEKERVAELTQRRARVAKTIGPTSLLILFSTEPRVYTNDVDYQYRQENNLYYLTNLKQKGATLVLLPENTQTPEILFLPRRNPAAETWTGHMYSPQEAKEASGIKEIWEAREFEPFLRALRKRQPYRPKAENVLLSEIAGPNPAAGAAGFEKLFGAAAKNEASVYLLIPGEAESREYKQEQRFASDWAKSASSYSVKNAAPIFSQMRLSKSPMELRLMQHAIDISTEAHERAWVAAAAAKWEYEVDAEVAYTFKLRNADNWGYPDIVGSGPNATTLHYEESQGAIEPNDLMLMDCGAEYEHY